MRIERGGERDVSRGRQSQRTNFLPSGRPKCELGAFEKAMYQWVALACENIFCLMAVPKLEFGEVEKR
jgi:hypothetical protein